MKTIFGVATILFVGLIGVMAYIHYQSLSTVTIVNNSGLIMDNIALSIADERYFMKNLENGESVSVVFSVDRDSDVKMHITFIDSEKEMQESFGYFTNGLGVKYTVFVNEHLEVNVQ